MDAVDRGAWRRRWRWRMRGALTWPLFVGLTIAEAVVLHLLPIAGSSIALAGAFLIAAVLNLVVVAAIAPVTAHVLRRRGRASAPLEIVTDRVAAVAMLGLGVVFVAIGIAHHPSVAAAQREDTAMRAAVYRFVVTQRPAYRDGLHHASVVKPGAHLFRVCLPGADPTRALCLYVQTDQSPPGVTVDPDHTPNALLLGRG